MKTRLLHRLAHVALGLVLSLLAAAAGALAWQVDVEGPIGPALADHTVRALEEAQQAGAQFVLLRIDTPGGLDSSMRHMIKAILASSIPVVAHVAPSGARAASAGTYLLYASHVAAMANGTNLGAATPVQVGSPGLPKPGGGEEPAAGAPSAMERKMVNDAVAYIQSLAQLRGRNAEWAERAVREGASLAAADALEAGVIDLLADSSSELLAALDGREVDMGNGQRVTLQTEGMVLSPRPMDWRSKFLAVITNPNIAYVLMLAGIYGLLIEFYNPGIGLPGVVGAVSLLLALYAFQVLPVSYAGLGLMLLGVALMVAEAMAPSFGILGLGGIVAFVVGSIMLMDTELPAYQLALPLIVAVTVFSAALLIFALGLILRARRSALVSGVEHLLGEIAEVETIRDGEVYVRLDGELWHAQADSPLAPHDEVVVDAFEGLTLKVSKHTGESSDD